jgi:hypothetical protein
MQSFIRRENIKLLQQAIDKESDPGKRVVLERLLADEKAKAAKAKIASQPKNADRRPESL